VFLSVGPLSNEIFSHDPPLLQIGGLHATFFRRFFPLRRPGLRVLCVLGVAETCHSPQGNIDALLALPQPRATPRLAWSTPKSPKPGNGTPVCILRRKRSFCDAAVERPIRYSPKSTFFFVLREERIPFPDLSLPPVYDHFSLFNIVFLCTHAPPMRAFALSFPRTGPLHLSF